MNGGSGAPGRVVQAVRSNGFAGVERYIADISGELHRRGWELHVIGGDPQRMRAELPDGVRHRAAAHTPAVARALWAVGECSVVHAHMTAAELPAAVLRRRNRAPLLVTRHFPGRRGTTPAGRAAAPFIARRVAAQIAVSDYVASHIGEPSRVLPSGVRPGANESLPRERIVTVLQRLEPEKRTDVAVRAWAATDLAGLGWRLDIVGAGSRLAELTKLAEALRVADSVRFSGRTSTPREVLARSAMLVAPTPNEALGLVVLEAMAEGTPVLAADGGAHRETLGEAGVYFAPGDVDACAEQLAALAASPGRRLELGEALRNRQRARFDLFAHVDALESLYLSLARR